MTLDLDPRLNLVNATLLYIFSTHQGRNVAWHEILRLNGRKSNKFTELPYVSWFLAFQRLHDHYFFLFLDLDRRASRIKRYLNKLSSGQKPVTNRQKIANWKGWMNRDGAIGLARLAYCSVFWVLHSWRKLADA